MLDNRTQGALSCDIPGARGQISPPAPCDSNAETAESFKFGHGGARLGAGRRRNVPVIQMPLDVDRWYVVRAKYGETGIADREIREAGFTVFTPTIFRPAIPSRRDASGIMRPGKPDRTDYLFVRYILTRLNLSDPSWRDVLEMPGVERIISGGHLANGGIGIPIAVPDRAIEWVRQLLNPNGCIDPRMPHDKPIKAGTSVRLLDGPMADHAGICEMSDGQRVVLLLNLLGRPVRVTVAQSAVEVA